MKKLRSRGVLFFSVLAVSLPLTLTAPPAVADDPSRVILLPSLQGIVYDEQLQLQAHIDGLIRESKRQGLPFKRRQEVRSELLIHYAVMSEVKTILGRNPSGVEKMDGAQWVQRQLEGISKRGVQDEQGAYEKWDGQSFSLTTDQTRAMGLIHRVIDRIGRHSEERAQGKTPEARLYWNETVRFSTDRKPPSTEGAQLSDQYLEITDKKIRSDRAHDYYEAKLYDFDGKTWVLKHTYLHALKRGPATGEHEDVPNRAVSPTLRKPPTIGPVSPQSSGFIEDMDDSSGAGSAEK